MRPTHDYTNEGCAHVILPHGGSTMAGATSAHVLDIAARYVRYYLTDIDGPQYSHVDVEIHSACPICKGNGRRLKPRTKHAYIDCAKCDSGWHLATSRVRITRESVKDAPQYCDDRDPWVL